MLYEINTQQTASNKAPVWVYHYVRRNVGMTRNSRYRYWNTVLGSDLSACIWNKLQHDFQQQGLTELQRNWYPVHYRHVIDHAPITAYDKSLLHFKLYSHLQQVQQQERSAA